MSEPSEPEMDRVIKFDEVSWGEEPELDSMVLAPSRAGSGHAVAPAPFTMPTQSVADLVDLTDQVPLMKGELAEVFAQGKVVDDAEAAEAIAPSMIALRQHALARVRREQAALSEREEELIASLLGYAYRGGATPSVRQLAALLDLPVSTTHRLLQRRAAAAAAAEAASPMTNESEESR